MSPTYPSADKVESSLAEASLGQDFRQFLRAELIRRCKKNAKYSLRAFAQALGVSPAYLSMIFNGRKKPVAATILKMGKALGLNPKEILRFQNRLQESTAKTTIDTDEKSDIGYL